MIVFGGVLIYVAIILFCVGMPYFFSAYNADGTMIGTISTIISVVALVAGIILLISGIKKLKYIQSYNKRILDAFGKENAQNNAASNSKKPEVMVTKGQIPKESYSNGKAIYQNLQGAQKVLSVYSDHVELTQILNARAAISGNWTQGNKEIYYSDMTSVQYREATNVLLGYIQFEVPGIVSANNYGSENSWTFSVNFNDLSKEITAYVRSRIREEKTSKNTVSSQPIIENHISTADELKKYKELLDGGVITQEEFDMKKKQLLGL